jgi:hypothetical protein
VTIYLVRLADMLGVDLLEVADAKLERNHDRFPPGDVQGRADVELWSPMAAETSQEELRPRSVGRDP